MTDKLHCPFCGAELVQANTTVKKIWHCPNIDCKGHNYFGVDDFWNTIISGKKAQDALKGIEIRVAAIRSCVQDGYTQLGERNRNIFIALELFKDLTKEITSITKQEI